MDGGDFSAQEILENKTAVVVYFAALLVLIIIIMWTLRKNTTKSSEHYFGYGMPNSYQVLAGAPDIRFQEFSGTNQGSTPVNTATVKQLYPELRSKSERLTGSREPPVFYDISQTLAEYQYASQFNCADGSAPLPARDTYGNMTYACPDGSTPASGGSTGLDMTSLTGTEHATASPATAVQEALLMKQLGY